MSTAANLTNAVLLRSPVIAAPETVAAVGAMTTPPSLSSSAT